MKLPSLGQSGRSVWVAVVSLLVGMAGCNKDGAAGSNAKPSASSIPSSEQKSPNAAAVEVHITASKKGFKPALATLKKGRPGVLIFERIDDAECANAVKLPFLKETVALPRGKKVRVEVPTGEDGTFRYSCWMRMLFGRVVIEP